jgi:signal peptidase I
MSSYSNCASSNVGNMGKASSLGRIAPVAEERTRAALDATPASTELAGQATADSTEAAPAKKLSPLAKELLSLILKIAAILAAAALLLTFVYGLQQNVGDEMAPAVKDGDLVAFYRLDKNYSSGDLLLLSYQGEQQIRRVVAVAGDSVDITDAGLLVNGALQQEPEIYEPTNRYAKGIDFPLTVPAGQVFVLADSREDGTDSRVYGAVDTDDTLGSVISVIRRRGL